MPESSPAATPKAAHAQDPIVNRLSIQVATVNGSGSQTANNTLLRAIFQMGIPVSGKNLFPSNIAGLPTWFTIRANKPTATSPGGKEIDVLVCMNADTAVERREGRARRRGRRLRRHARLEKHRAPTSSSTRCRSRSSCATCCPDAKLRKLVVNMVYVGVARRTCSASRSPRSSGRSPKAFAQQAQGARAEPGGRARPASTYAQGEPRSSATRFRVSAHGRDGRQDPGRRQHRRRRSARCSRGVTVRHLVPDHAVLEPLRDASSTTLRSTASTRRPAKATFAIVQAEDELAAIGMVIGAGWAGARAMTTHERPGHQPDDRVHRARPTTPRSPA